MEPTPREVRILWIRRGWVGVEHLDSARREGLRIVRTDRFVEGEILRIAPGRRDRPREVLSSRIDPGYAPGGLPRLVTYTLPEVDPALGPYRGLLQPVSAEAERRWFTRVPAFPREDPGGQARTCRELVERHPLFLDPLRRLGELEWLRGRKERGRKYLETAWTAGRSAFPRRFEGAFDHRNGYNLPLFRVGTRFAVALAQFGRNAAGLEVLEFLLEVDRPGTYRAGGLVPALKLRAGRLPELLHTLSSEEPLGTNEFLRALILQSEGWEERAVRAVLAGMRSNPLVLRTLMTADGDAEEIPLRDGPSGFASEAALHAGLTGGEWRRRKALRLLAKLVTIPAFFRAYRAAKAAARESDRHPPCHRTFGAREKFRECFSDFVTEAVVRAAVGSL